jgi:hypothetical protein
MADIFTFQHNPSRLFSIRKEEAHADLLEKWNLNGDHTQLLCFDFEQAFFASMAAPFITALLESPALRQNMKLADGRGGFLAFEAAAAATPKVRRVDFVELRATCTSLDLFDRLVNGDIVRETEQQHICKMMDQYLPCGITVADQLRSAFMNTSESEFGVGLFSEEEKNELLYHIMWRILTGGALNQWEDHFTTYRDFTRDAYRDFVCVGKQSDDEVKVLSHVYLVQGAEGVPLFPKSDEMEPSNGNYFYVVVNPTRKEVVVWYHGFWSMF